MEKKHLIDGAVYSHKDGKKIYPDMTLTRKDLIDKLKEFVDGKINNKELQEWEDYIWAHDYDVEDEEDPEGGDSFTMGVMGELATDGNWVTKKQVKEMIKLLESKENYKVLYQKLQRILKLPKLPELPEDIKRNEELRDIIGDLYEVDGYLAGAISTKRIELIKKGVKFMEELLTKLKKIKTNILNGMNKNGIVADYLVWLILAIFVLIVTFFISISLFGKGEGMIVYIKDLLRLR